MSAAPDRSQRAALAAGLLLLAASAFAFVVVRWQMGGYDLSPLVDLSHRLARGETPGRDFILTFPPLLVLATKLVSFGTLHWLDLTVANVVAAFATLALLIAAGDDAFRSRWTGLATGALVAIPLVYTNHVWHSTLSQYAAMVLVAVLSAELAPSPPSPDLAAPKPRMLLVAAASALVAISKQNVAVPLLGLTVAYLAVVPLSPGRRGRLLVAVAGGALAGVALAALALGMGPSELAYLYTATAGRMRPDPQMVRDLLDLRTLAPLGMVFAVALVETVAACRGREDRWNARLGFLIVAGCASVLPILTDWDAKENDASLPLFVLLLVQTGAAQRVASRAFVTAVGAMLCVAVAGGWTRERMMRVGPFWEPIADRRIRDGYFAGLWTGGQFQEIVRELRQVRASRPQRLFCGPRLELCYAMLEVGSPRGLPLWWHPGSSYALRDTRKVVDAFVANDFDVLVFAGNDTTRMPEEILRYIDAHYRPVSGYSVLSVLERRRDVP